MTLQSGWKVSLDCQYPESAVYKFEKAGRLVEEYLQAAGQAGPMSMNPPPPLSGLPPGWTTGIDQSSGQQYDDNEQTGQSQWDLAQY